MPSPPVSASMLTITARWTSICRLSSSVRGDAEARGELLPRRRPAEARWSARRRRRRCAGRRPAPSGWPSRRSAARRAPRPAVGRGRRWRRRRRRDGSNRLATSTSATCAQESRSSRLTWPGSEMRAATALTAKEASGRCSVTSASISCCDRPAAPAGTGVRVAVALVPVALSGRAAAAHAGGGRPPGHGLGSRPSSRLTRARSAPPSAHFLVDLSADLSASA